ncbi:hypothetical protein RJP21_04590 [Paenibacillus sp. VCA1]|uniref:hypothetical protein n=1 Tax=Paenibacillus sp. VCA1 TaxID=3039148 RepID=UPI002870E52B|nr:hypothetical protein [Paenibacillus sp. VCA1]MDR9852878.1 hypothetical protein [Paenibacillus sp. VCA1]
MVPEVTEEDHALIKPYILLPLILSAFERDMNAIKAAVKTPDPYVDVLSTAMDRATHELTELRHEFRKRGIKVYELERTRIGYTAHYLCRGYQRTFSILDGLVRAEAGVLMRKFLSVSADE